jgi:nicotinate-nucleotide--dimethylbenzimidazole phosphoribosyltransferase
MPAPADSFDEIRMIVSSLPRYDAVVAEETRLHLHGLGGAAGALSDLTVWLAGGQRTALPRVQRPRLALFAATHGMAITLPGGSPDALGREVAALVAGGGVLHRMAETADSDLRLYELALERPTGDARIASAMDEATTARAIAYGMMAVEPGIDVLAVAALGVGAAVSAAAIGYGLFGGAVEDWMHGHAASVAEAAQRHGGLKDPLGLLAAIGGPDIAAILGAILAARLVGIPILLDGAGACAAGALAAGLRADLLDHCRRAAGDPYAAKGFAVTPPIAQVLPTRIDAPLAAIAALPVLKMACALVE